MTRHHRVGVVIATRNRRDRLAGTLRHLTDLPERPDILVADNASTDGTRAMVARDFPTYGSSPSPATTAPSPATTASAPSTPRTSRSPTTTPGGSPAHSPAPPACSTPTRGSD